MSFWILVMAAVLVGIFFLYKNARRKQRAIRAEAARNYDATKALVLAWDQNRDDTQLTETAKQAASAHRRRRMNCEFMRGGRGGGSVEDDIYLKAYAFLLEEEALCNNFLSPMYSPEALRFQGALSDLHMLS